MPGDRLQELGRAKTQPASLVEQPDLDEGDDRDLAQPSSGINRPEGPTSAAGEARGVGEMPDNCMCVSYDADHAPRTGPRAKSRAAPAPDGNRRETEPEPVAAGPIGISRRGLPARTCRPSPARSGARFAGTASAPRVGPASAAVVAWPAATGP